MLHIAIKGANLSAPASQVPKSFRRKAVEANALINRAQEEQQKIEHDMLTTMAYYTSVYKCTEEELHKMNGDVVHSDGLRAILRMSLRTTEVKLKKMANTFSSFLTAAPQLPFQSDCGEQLKELDCALATSVSCDKECDEYGLSDHLSDDDSSDSGSVCEEIMGFRN